MSHDYAMSRVRDALEKSDGNHLKAQRLIMSWLEKDQSLLFGLAAPHLPGIVSHAVNHAAAPRKEEKAAPPEKIDLSAVQPGEFGAALIEGLQGRPPAFGEPPPRNVGKPGKTSQQHIDAINALARAGTGKEDAKKDKGGKKK